MNIIDNRPLPAKESFGSLLRGHVFEHDDNIYMKIEGMYDRLGNVVYNAVRLDVGSVELFDECEEVLKLECELVIN